MWLWLYLSSLAIGTWVLMFSMDLRVFFFAISCGIGWRWFVLTSWCWLCNNGHCFTFWLRFVWMCWHVRIVSGLETWTYAVLNWLFCCGLGECADGNIVCGCGIPHVLSFNFGITMHCPCCGSGAWCPCFIRCMACLCIALLHVVWNWGIVILTTCPVDWTWWWHHGMCDTFLGVGLASMWLCLSACTIFYFLW